MGLLTHKVFVYFLQAKTEVPPCFVKFKSRVKNETGFKIKCMRTDNGTEFCNNRLLAILDKSGIRHQTTVPYSHARLKNKFWAEAVANVVYVLNCSVSTRNNHPH